MIEEYLSPENLQKWWQSAIDWLLANVLNIESLVQLGVIAAAFLVALFVAPKLRRQLARVKGRLAKAATTMSELALPLVWLVLQWLSIQVAAAVPFPHQIMRITASLLTAWVIIHLVSQLVRNPALSRAVAWTAWTLAALNILQLLQPAVGLLDSYAMTLGGVRVSLYTVAKSTVALAVLLWAATQGSSVLETRIHNIRDLSPSLKVLMGKALRIVLMTIAVVVAIRSVGIDLTIFAVLGGAIGLGVGFGLQRIIGNLISGVILLVDKSIKPGDVIAVEDTYGWVNSLGARYVSVITRDGTEHLIPNETLVTERVENWTHSDNQRRLKIPVGVHYDSDVHKAIALCTEAAAETERVLSNPGPRCLLKGFGDNSVDIEIRFWIGDAQAGISNVKSAVLLNVWDKFREHGIEIPYPQRDVHLKTAGGLATLGQAAGAG